MENFVLAFVLSGFTAHYTHATENYISSSFAPESVESTIQQTVSNQKIVVVGETHQSRTSFEKRGSAFLVSLQRKGFDCLFLERSRNTFRPFYDQFNRGKTFESSVALAHGLNSTQWGIPLDIALDQIILEQARLLGFKIHAMDIDITENVKRLFQETLVKGETQEWRQNENRRNHVMVTEIANALNSNECRRVLAVVGASHLYRSAYAESPVLKSIPHILNESGWDHVLFRFLPGNTMREKNFEIYNAVFSDASGT